jgi:Ser/Thr protein kinase RdoA (MazF antagonist)
MTVSEIPAEVQRAYGLSTTDAGRSVVPIPSLINRTFLVLGDLGQGPRAMVLQRLHPVFGAQVHLDIEAVTRHLQRHRIETPHLLRNRDGALWLEEGSDGDRHVWRASSYVEGITIHRSSDRAQLGSAAELLGRFHGGLLDLQHEFVHLRPLHDTRQHLTKLEHALASERGRADAEARELGEQILEHSRAVRLDFSEFPQRILHGDPKLSNVRFDSSEPTRARCMIDLDTLGRGYLAYELGDALRSWGNRAGEHLLEADFDPEVLRAVVAGYARACPVLIPDEEICSAVAGLETVSLELASRFAADAVLDSYFGWDPTRFPTRRAHNLLRARGQFSLARCVQSQAGLLQTIARQALSSRAPEQC